MQWGALHLFNTTCIFFAPQIAAGNRSAELKQGSAGGRSLSHEEGILSGPSEPGGQSEVPTEFAEG